MARELPDRIPAHLPTPSGVTSQAPQRHILMTPHMAAIGGLIAFFSVVAMVVVLPTATYTPPPSQNWLPLSDAEVRGRATYLANGCMYCHSGFSRPQDVFVGQYYLYSRASEPGDYAGASQSPNVLGSERTGPDLSQEGGNHPDDWHVAHYGNPRFVTPLSIMPRFNFWSAQELRDMIAFNQSAGGKQAALRAAAQDVGKALMAINEKGDDPAASFPDLVAELQRAGRYVPNGKGEDPSPWGLPWMAVWMVNSFERGYWLTPDPLPVTQQNLTRGKMIFVQRCAACHGVQGDGKGPGAQFLSPSPFDFTKSGMMGARGAFASDGMFYHRILTAGKGTAMENFGTRLSVEDIWRVVLFLRTIDHGSLEEQGSVPTVEMWQGWTPPQPLLNYIQAHPIEEGPGVIATAQTDPFAAAAHWLAPGLGPQDEVLVGGKLAITRQRLAALVRDAYLGRVRRAYQEAQRRGDVLPPLEQTLDTRGLEWHSP